MKYILTNTVKAAVDAAAEALGHSILGSLTTDGVYLKQFSTSSNPTFLLYCQGETYELEYEDGMTFEQWVASSYNNNNLQITRDGWGKDNVVCHTEEYDNTWYYLIENTVTSKFAEPSDKIQSILYTDESNTWFS